MRKVLIVVAASSLASFVIASQQYGQLDVRIPIPRDHYLRQLVAPAQTTTANSPATTTAAQASSEAHSATTLPTSAAPASSTTQQPSSTQPASTTQASSTAAATSSQPPSADPATSQKSTVVGTVATNSAGDLITSVVTVAASSSPSSTTPPGDNNSDSGVGTGTIIGLSVAGGVAVIAIICFFVWKFTRKRFNDFDDNEAIKWPELNSHSGGGDVHALPTNSTGRAGFGAENDSDLNLVRAPSPGGTYAQSIATSSVGGAHDPYAVPPLPHLNPNQPYTDDPGAYGQPGFYDPYRGPIPNTFGEGLVDPGVEAIPMTQMARTRSPGPQVAYDMHGRASPSPQAGYGYGPGIVERAASPALSGTRSPAPHVAPYGYGQ